MRRMQALMRLIHPIEHVSGPGWEPDLVLFLSRWVFTITIAVPAICQSCSYIDILSPLYVFTPQRKQGGKTNVTCVQHSKHCDTKKARHMLARMVQNLSRVVHPNCSLHDNHTPEALTAPTKHWSTLADREQYMLFSDRKHQESPSELLSLVWVYLSFPRTAIAARKKPETNHVISTLIRKSKPRFWIVVLNAMYICSGNVYILTST